MVSATPRDGQVHVTFADGDTQIVDHLLFGTGYRVDITRYPFLTPGLTERIRRAGGYPLLGRGMESSVPGLHFLGAPSAWSFGPIVRFVSGGWYTSRALVRAIAGPSRLRGPVQSRRPFLLERDRRRDRQDIASRAAGRPGPGQPRRWRGGDRRWLPGPGYRAQSRKTRHPRVPHR